MSDGRETGEVEGRIRNRNSWLRVFVVVAVVVISAWKLVVTPVQIDLTRFDFSDFLSLILALFAVALSIAFYLKATDTSNAFYDNTYRFTRDVSEILGRIEAGFGERLRHLDEGYSGLIDRLPGVSPEQGVAPEQVKQDIVVEQKKLEEVEEGRNQLLAKLTERAKMQEDDKKKFLADLQARDLQLAESRKEIAILSDRLQAAEAAAEEQAAGGAHGEAEAVSFRGTIRTLANFFPRSFLREAPAERLSQEVRLALSTMPESRARILKRVGIVGEDMMLTERGLSEFRRIGHM